MDGDSISHEKGTANNKEKSAIDILGDSDVSEPPRVRRSLLFCDENDRILLDYNWHILPWISLLLWFVFLAS
jgi:hypothetical protein